VQTTVTGIGRAARRTTGAHAWLLAALVGALAGTYLGSCTPAYNAAKSEEAGAVPTDLEDGTYSCNATNSSRGNGPYTLECEKSGDRVILHFANGGHVTLDIGSQETADGHSWQIEASHAETGDSWELTIEE